MTPKKYQDLIKASGGFTKADRRRGDRPQPLSQKDESALDRAWKKTAEKQQVSTGSKKQKENKAA